MTALQIVSAILQLDMKGLRSLPLSSQVDLKAIARDEKMIRLLERNGIALSVKTGSIFPTL